jgi:hypothetical protein
VSHYDVAQICPNGHVITSVAGSYPQHRQQFCEKRGEPTLMNCPKCDVSMRTDHKRYSTSPVASKRLVRLLSKIGKGTASDKTGRLFETDESEVVENGRKKAAGMLSVT